jgi:hypothetical protein
MATQRAPDWIHASPREIEEDIDATRENLRRHLDELRRKLTPSPRLRRIVVPAALAAAGMLAGGLTWLLIRRRRHPVRARLKELKLRSAGARDQVRALRLVVRSIRKGKPAVFIVDPGR